MTLHLPWRFTALVMAALSLILSPALATPSPTQEAAILVQSKARGGILGKKAPPLGVSTWFNVPKGRDHIDLDDHLGKVRVLFFFQSWCPGCHSRGFPTMKALAARYAGSKDVALLAVQTVFEGFGTNTKQAAREAAQRHGLKIPVGHDAGPEDSGSRVMRRYRSRGTPWIVVIDREGVVRYNAFHLPATRAVALVEELRQASGAKKAP